MQTELTMQVALVVAYASNRVIGCNGVMPWRQHADLKHFKVLTLGHPVIMGRKTFQSIGKPLPERVNIVITRDPDFAAEGVQVAANVTEALAMAAVHCHAAEKEQIMIIGGGEIYAQTLPFAHVVHATEIDAEPEGDAVFPLLPEGEWRETARECHPAGEKDDYPFCFVTYKKV